MAIVCQVATFFTNSDFPAELLSFFQYFFKLPADATVCVDEIILYSNFKILINL